MKKKFDSLKSGAGEEDAFKPIWQFYDAMEVFSKDVYECKSICNSEEHTQDGEESLRTDELDVGRSNSTTEVQNSDAGNSALQYPSQNSNPATASKVVQKRRSQNPPELQEANKHMNIAFSTLNSVLQSKKHQEDKENDDAGLFCKLLAKQLRDFPKEERDELMYEIHGLIINKRHRSSGRMLQPAISSPITVAVYTTTVAVHRHTVPITRMIRCQETSLRAHTSFNSVLCTLIHLRK
ncbi:unnamed protein product [Arctia plantaginis]|uniref:BESS domain-containing protein n=1 Tax=Arctia plantaginis TaxID=874455 RepID=A0A8S0ZCK8_ARCPL|nr:unnamed protein product [Arctia plantaginis]